jgi:WD40 repeat protein
MRLFQGHTGEIGNMALAYSPDGRMLVSGSQDKTAKVWDLATAKEKWTFKGHKEFVDCACFGLGGAVVVTGSHDGAVILWDVKTGKKLKRWTIPGKSVCSMAIAPDGRSVAAAGGRMFGSRGNKINRFDLDGRERPEEIGQHSTQIGALAYSGDGSMIASGDYYSNVNVWNVATGQLLQTMRHRSHVQGLAFSPDGKLLATTGGQSVFLWGSPGGTSRGQLKGHRGTVMCLAFSPDGQLLASASLDRTVRVWDVATGRLRTAFRWPIGQLHAVTFSPNGMTMAAGGDKDIVIWDLDE